MVRNNRILPKKTGVANLGKQMPFPRLVLAQDAEAIKHLEQAITDGKHWNIALLKAIDLWASTEEVCDGRHYRYLIDDEAFDWLLLAERLCEAVDGLLPNDEKVAFLLYGKPPLNLTPKEFKALIGSGKYHQYLNYFYGVTVEEALILAVQEEVCKERRALGYIKEQDYANEAYQRIYGTIKATLLRQFRRDKGYPQTRSISLTELKEFAYWLFKYRLDHCDKARVASDTKKALTQLKNNGFPRNLVTGKATY